MSDYAKSYNGAAKDAAEDIILGADFDTEFSAIESAVATKANKTPPVTPGNVATLSASGDLQDSGVTSTELAILDGATVTTAELNTLDGITATVGELNTLDGITATVTELNVLDGITASTTELNYTDGVTSSIQTQIDNTNTTSNILSLTAGASVGAVGTYAFLGTTLPNPYFPGDTLAGSSLRYAGIRSTTSWTNISPTATNHTGNGGTPAGTWRCMGFAYDGAGGAEFGATLWLRVS